MIDTPSQSTDDASVPEHVRLEALASFAPRLRDPGASFGSFTVPGRGETSHGLTQLPYWSYSVLAEEFIDMAYQSGWIDTNFDWGEWQDTAEGKRLLSNPAAILEADATQLLKLMTAILRSDRFVEGGLGKAFETGIITAITERAAALLEA